MFSLSEQKTKISCDIERAENKHFFINMVRGIAMDDLKCLFDDYVSQQSSLNTVARIFYCTHPLIDTIDTDYGRSILHYLRYRDALRLSRTCKRFHTLIGDFATMHLRFALELLRLKPVFRSRAFYEQQTERLSTTYALQNEYAVEHLNSMSFDELGKRAILTGDDLAIWKLCRRFACSTALFGYAEECMHTTGRERYHRYEQPVWCRASERPFKTHGSTIDFHRGHWWRPNLSRVHRLKTAKIHGMLYGGDDIFACVLIQCNDPNVLRQLREAHTAEAGNAA